MIHTGFIAEPETDSFKRLVAWKGLKIRSISIRGNTISIACYKGKKNYFINITEDEVNVYNNKKECIDTISIPKAYKYRPPNVTTSGADWTYISYYTDKDTTLNPQWTTTSNNTAASYKISFE